MTIETTLAVLGFTSKATLTKDDFDGRDGQSHWSIAIGRAGHNRKYDFEFHMGCGNRSYIPDRRGFEMHKPVKPGDRRLVPMPTGRSMTIFELEARQRSIPNVPTLTDVLYCLVLDTNCDDYADYEEWAGEYGYDEDSRKGYKAWEACLEQSRRFRQLLGAGDLERLQDLFQDY